MWVIFEDSTWRAQSAACGKTQHTTADLAKLFARAVSAIRWSKKSNFQNLTFPVAGSKKHSVLTIFNHYKTVLLPHYLFIHTRFSLLLWSTKMILSASVYYAPELSSVSYPLVYAMWCQSRYSPEKKKTKIISQTHLCPSLISLYHCYLLFNILFILLLFTPLHTYHYQFITSLSNLASLIFWLWPNSASWRPQHSSTSHFFSYQSLISLVHIQKETFWSHTNERVKWYKLNNRHIHSYNSYV